MAKAEIMVEICYISGHALVRVGNQWYLIDLEKYNEERANNV